MRLHEAKQAEYLYFGVASPRSIIATLEMRTVNRPSLQCLQCLKSNSNDVIPRGGGPIGCGCGVILGLGIGVLPFLKLGSLGLTLAVALGALGGSLGWKFGDSFFENVLSGNPDGKPMRYWWWR